MDEDELLQVRRFNRTVTQRIGVLSDNYLGSGRPLGEARLLFEVGREGATVRDLRARLGLDSGYLSRLLRRLEAQKLTTTRRDAADARVRRVELTPRGKKEWDILDQRSREMAASLLAGLGASQRQRLLAAMVEAERLLRASAVTLEAADPLSVEARACIQAYFRELQERFDAGFDPGLSVSAEPEELVPPLGWLLVARLDGEPVGCGALKIKQGRYGEIKRMWVAPSARRLGIAQRLLDALEARAVAAGVDVLQLDTNRHLAEARSLYLRNGYAEIPPYNNNPYAHYWFEKRLTRDISARQSSGPPRTT
ncbi:MAG: MarR family transcriptional regulator [Castellaniella sp.]|uniref:bifunctional helix-turn-helix transcriptional regulator/GNAT family N-acetyltransferase n=1 Tax=Castellaniella sp. TaxID=1955812 RepID=UPI0012142F61|nr:helix-turn-helix domain-containing GNAT family N-acetyltransferase [Castellaniella sp.]TAN27380.1 MAG: MarR family transcriptional regulator [Castellaniella sp.]